jgi:hypothetical protein
MSTWISKIRRGAGAKAPALALVAVLAGCVGAPNAPAPRSVTVADGGLRLAAPRGFCVDQRSLRDAGAAAFVLFGNCAALSGNAEDARPDYPVVLSATVSTQTGAEGIERRFDQMRVFFRSPAGRAALSRAGKAETVEVLDIRTADDLLLIRLSDSAPMGDAPVSETYWRAFSGVGGRILSLSVLPLKNRPVSDAAQRSLLQQFAAHIRANNQP